MFGVDLRISGVTYNRRRFIPRKFRMFNVDLRILDVAEISGVVY